MKKRLFIIFAVSIGVLLAGCEKENIVEIVDYNSGEIPGLGNTEGELTGRPFKLPDGVTLTQDMHGGAESGNYFMPAWGYSAVSRMAPLRGKDLPPPRAFVSTRSDEDVPVVYRGSGYGYVDIYVSLSNSNNRTTTVEFPAGLILENVGGNSQNGVLIKKAEVQIEARSEILIVLAFYCGNASRSSAYSDDYYTLGVVTDAAPIIDLCERVANKRINIEEFDPASIEDYYEYISLNSKLQDIVWSVTDGSGLDEYEIEYINSLPDSR